MINGTASDVEDDGFKHFSGVNWVVCSVRDRTSYGYINKGGRWLLIQRFREIGPEIQGRRAFSWIYLACGRCRGKGKVNIRLRRGLVIGCHGGLREVKGRR